MSIFKLRRALQALNGLRRVLQSEAATVPVLRAREAVTEMDNHITSRVPETNPFSTVMRVATGGRSFWQLLNDPEVRKDVDACAREIVDKLKHAYWTSLHDRQLGPAVRKYMTANWDALNEVLLVEPYVNDDVREYDNDIKFALCLCKGTPNASEETVIRELRALREAAFADALGAAEDAALATARDLKRLRM